MSEINFELENFRGLVCEIRDLSIGGAMYAAEISCDKIDGRHWFGSVQERKQRDSTHR